MHLHERESDDGYGDNHFARASANWRVEAFSPDDKCLCHGGGWALDPFDAWFKCPHHAPDARHPEDDPGDPLDDWTELYTDPERMGMDFEDFLDHDHSMNF